MYSLKKQTPKMKFIQNLFDILFVYIFVHSFIPSIKLH